MPDALPPPPPGPVPSPPSSAGARTEGDPGGPREGGGLQAGPPGLPSPSSPRHLGSGIGLAIAWLWIIALVAFAMLRPGEHDEGAAAPPDSVSTPAEITARVVLSADHALRSQPSAGITPDQILSAAQPLSDGPPVEQIAYAILVAELQGADRGAEELNELPVASWKEPADVELAAAVAERLSAWEAGGDASSRTLDPDDAKRLGYFAKILAGTTRPSVAVILWLGTFGLWYVVAGLAGFAFLITALALAIVGRLTPRVTPASLRGRLYAETFAIWITLFFGISMVGGLVAEELAWHSAAFVVAILAMFVSLSALAWPVFRGARWADVRSDIGWTAGRGVIVESAYGLVGYAIALPLMLGGVVVTLILTKLFQSTAQPSHPAVEGIGNAGPAQLLALFTLACVAAPIVEETMFRGVLYRHLRDASSAAGTIASMCVAALVSSVLFAAIHPQGLLFIPILTGLALGFCMAREFRGSLIPGIIAHAVTNFITLSLNVLLMGGG